MIDRSDVPWCGASGSGTTHGYEVQVRTDSEPTMVCGLLLSREWRTIEVHHNQTCGIGLSADSAGTWRLGVACAEHELPMLIQCNLVSEVVANAIRAMIIAAARSEQRPIGPGAMPWPKLETRIVARRYTFSYSADDWPEHAIKEPGAAALQQHASKVKK